MFSVKSIAGSWDAGHGSVVQTLGGDRKVIIEGAADGRYLPTGHLAYAVSGVLLAVPLDISTLAVTGSAVPIVEGVRRTLLSSTGTGAAQCTPLPTMARLAFIGGLSNALGDRRSRHRPLRPQG